jgi:fructokinase
MGFRIVGLGELLWDLLPDGKKLGGAPANFAFHARSLGDEGLVASRIGQDPLGREIGARLVELGLPGQYVQEDPGRPTGTVQVALDSQGMPTYTITPEVAWDYLSWTPELAELAGAADAVCFGSLAQRGPTARDTIRRFLAATRRDALRLFDVNLRQSWYSAEVLRESLEAAGIVKLNDAELPVVLRTLGLPADDGLPAGCRRLREAFGLHLVCLTLGAAGSLLAGPQGELASPGVPVRVADTIGAGDAFTAVLCHHWLRGSSLERIGEAANRYGSWVAGQAGATPSAPADLLAGVRAAGRL